jgi:NADH-quinone oxidoreductase subunit H
VAGPTTEYTGIKFGLFAVAEYIHSVLASALGAALFLGGWDGPFGPPVLWMLLKTTILFVVITWLGWTLLRLRSDQLMMLCWIYLVPGGLALILVTGLYVHLGG